MVVRQVELAWHWDDLRRVPVQRRLCSVLGITTQQHHTSSQKHCRQASSQKHCRKGSGTVGRACLATGAVRRNSVFNWDPARSKQTVCPNAREKHWYVPSMELFGILRRILPTWTKRMQTL
jgi:hypothetical protein